MDIPGSFPGEHGVGTGEVIKNPDLIYPGQKIRIPLD